MDNPELPELEPTTGPETEPETSYETDYDSPDKTTLIPLGFKTQYFNAADGYDEFAVVELYDSLVAEGDTRYGDVRMKHLYRGTWEACEGFLKGMIHMALRIKKETGWTAATDGLEEYGMLETAEAEE